jgi:hypothetical protein
MEVKHTLVRNWLRAAFVAKDLDNNADSTSQLQINPELPEYFSVEQSSTFYTDLQIGFDDDNHTFGTTVANGIRNCLHPSSIPEPVEEVIGVDNVTARNVRPRTTTAAPANTANNALLQRVLQLEENLKEQICRTKRAQEAQQQRHPTPAPCAAVAFTDDSLPFGKSGLHRQRFQRRIDIPVPSTESTGNHVRGSKHNQSVRGHNYRHLCVW